MASNEEYRIAEIKDINFLKSEIRNFIAHGVTYEEITPIGFEAGALKQFAYRKSARPHKTKLAIAFQQSLPELRKKFARRLEEESNNYESVRFLNHQNEKIVRKVSEKFRDTRFEITPKSLPKRFFLFRRGLKKNEPVVIFSYNIKKSLRLSFFKASIIGDSAKRIIIGDISATSNNVYFSGLSYPFSETIDEEEIQDYDYFENREIDPYVKQIPAGMEYISFPRSSIQYTAFAVNFLGIDGRGNPIIGRGMFVNGDTISEEQIIQYRGQNNADKFCDFIQKRINKIQLITHKWVDWVD